jgi:predicted nucleic acid binding AN1-type Zn finger protein
MHVDVHRHKDARSHYFHFLLKTNSVLIDASLRLGKNDAASKITTAYCTSAKIAKITSRSILALIPEVFCSSSVMSAARTSQRSIARDELQFNQGCL